MTLLNEPSLNQQHERAVHGGVANLGIDFAGFLPGFVQANVVGLVRTQNFEDNLTLFGGFELMMREVKVEFFKDGIFLHKAVLMKRNPLVNVT